MKLEIFYQRGNETRKKIERNGEEMKEKGRQGRVEDACLLLVKLAADVGDIGTIMTRRKILMRC